MIQTFNQQQPQLAATSYVSELACVTGQVSLAADVSIWPMAVLRGDVNQITIGAASNIQDGCILHGTHAGEFNPSGYAVSVGERVTVGHRVTLHGCSIGDECLIGMGSIVMDGALIEPQVILAAGSLVAPGKVLSSGFLYRGSPARQQRPLTAEEIKFLTYSANYYVQLKNQYQTKE